MSTKKNYCWDWPPCWRRWRWACSPRAGTAGPRAVQPERKVSRWRTGRRRTLSVLALSMRKKRSPLESGAAGRAGRKRRGRRLGWRGGTEEQMAAGGRAGNGAGPGRRKLHANGPGGPAG